MSNPRGNVMSSVLAEAIEVAKRYRPCEPISAQHTMPIFMVMLPSATKGISSISIPWMVGSSVNHSTKSSLQNNITPVITNDIIIDMNMDL